jgi:formate hydrogenlyase subunit 3/multisubunit Na+/H+ antiporter MnhD subunit
MSRRRRARHVAPEARKACRATDPRRRNGRAAPPRRLAAARRGGLSLQGDSKPLAVLTVLALLIGALAVLGAAAWWLARSAAGARVVHGGVALAGVILAAGGVAGLLAGPAVLALPFGPPWGPARLALDPLSAWFLLPVGLSAACAALFALGGVHGPVAPRALVPWPIFLAGMALCVLAADGFTLLLGFEAMSVASWVLVAQDHAQAANRRAARMYLGFAGFGGVCLVLGFGLMAGWGGGHGLRRAARGTAGGLACGGGAGAGAGGRGVEGRAVPAACVAAARASGPHPAMSRR